MDRTAKSQEISDEALVLWGIGGKLKGYYMAVQEHELENIPQIVGTVVEEFEETEEDSEAELLTDASDMLKTCATLFEFIAEPDLCKNVTKRERTIIRKQLDRIYELTDALDKAVEELEELE